MYLNKFLSDKGLSRREIEVAQYVTQGLNNQEIADKLEIKEKTVKFHLTAVYKALKVETRAQMIVKCYQFR